MDSIRTVLLIIAALLLSCGPGVQRTTPLHPYMGDLKAREMEKAVHALVNHERERQGLSHLRLDHKLSNIARQHSEDMAGLGFFSHYSPDGMDFSYRYEQSGYRCAIQQGNTVFQGAENIFTISFSGGRSAERISEEIVSGWMQSPGHRSNILTPHWGRQGIGVALGNDGVFTVIYVTQNFC